MQSNQRVELNVVIQHTIQNISTMRYISAELAVCRLDWLLEVRGILLTQKERKWLLKRFTRTMERLGFRNHAGGEQTVEILRSH